MRTSVFLFLSTLFLIGCANSDARQEEEKSELHEIMKDHSWQISAITSSKAVDFNLDGEKSTDILAQNAPCQSDDVFALRSDNTLELIDGELSCQGRDLQNNRGAWSTNDTYLNLKLPNTMAVQFKVESFTKNEVLVSKGSPYPDEKDIVLTYTFTRID